MLDHGTHMTFDKYIYTLLSEVIISERMDSCKNLSSGQLQEPIFWSPLFMAVKTEKHFYPEDASQTIPQVPGLIQFTQGSLAL